MRFPRAGNSCNACPTKHDEAAEAQRAVAPHSVSKPSRRDSGRRTERAEDALGDAHRLVWMSHRSAITAGHRALCCAKHAATGIWHAMASRCNRHVASLSFPDASLLTLLL